MRDLTIDTDSEYTPKPLTDKDWKDFISEIHKINPEFIIPNDYKEFMIKYNGGSFLEYIIKDTLEGDLVLNWVHSWDRNKAQSLHVILEHSELLEEGLLVFASDPGGNEFLLNLNKDLNGQVYYWSHDSTFENGSDRILLFDSFSDFINSLEVEDD